MLQCSNVKCSNAQMPQMPQIADCQMLKRQMLKYPMPKCHDLLIVKCSNAYQRESSIPYPTCRCRSYVPSLAVKNTTTQSASVCSKTRVAAVVLGGVIANALSGSAINSGPIAAPVSECREVGRLCHVQKKRRRHRVRFV